MTSKLFSDVIFEPFWLFWRKLVKFYKYTKFYRDFVIEVETKKLGEGLRTLVPWTIANLLAITSCNDICKQTGK